MNATKTAYEFGYEDGAAAYRESGSTAAPVDGWDSDLINAIGFAKVCELFGLDEAAEKGGWSEKGLAALGEYCRGCQAGIEAAASPHFTLQVNYVPSDSTAWQDHAVFSNTANLVRYYEGELTHAQRVSYGYRVKNEDGSIDEMPDFMHQHAKEIV